MHNSKLGTSARRLAERPQWLSGAPVKALLPGIVLVIALALPLLAINLTKWPEIWFDEGLYLQVAKNLAQSGQYGILSSEGFREFDPLAPIGPTVVMPLFLAFKTAGIGLLQARLVMVGFGLLTILAFFTLASHVFNKQVAFAATLLLLATPGTTPDASSTFVALSRMVMGEVPLLLFMVTGSLLWFLSFDRRSNALALTAGFLFGLAAITKPQGMIILPVLFLVGIVNWLWHKQLSPRQVLIPLTASIICVVSWWGYQLLTGEAGSIARLGMSDQMLSHAAAALVSPTAPLKSVRALLETGAFVLVLPGLIYAAFLCGTRDLWGLKLSFLIILCATWLAWFVLGSIGWARHGFIALAIANIFGAKLLYDLSGGFNLNWRSIDACSPDTTAALATFGRNSAVALVLAIIVLTPLQQWADDMWTADSPAALRFVAYLNERVPQGAVIESAEPEIVFLSDLVFHQPSLFVIDKAIRHVQSDQPYPPAFYSLDETNPDYLVFGQFSKLTDLYRDALRTNQYALEYSAGPYDLFRRVNPGKQE